MNMLTMKVCKRCDCVIDSPCDGLSHFDIFKF